MAADAVFEYRANPTQTLVLKTLLYIFAALSFSWFLTSLWMYYEFSQADPATLYEDVLFNSEMVYGLIALMALPVYLVTVIVFGMWTYRTNKNLRALTGMDMKFTPGWAVGWYFIPIMNLFKPYQAMTEMWNVSRREFDAKGTFFGGLLGAWWICWLGTNAAARISNRLERIATTIDEAKGAVIAGAISDAVGVLAAVLAALVIGGVSKAMLENYDTESPGVAFDLDEAAVGYEEV